MKMDFKTGLITLIISLVLPASAYGAEYRKEGWPLPNFGSNRGFYSECMDGDGEEETVVEVFEHRNRNPILRYRTRLHNGGKGGYVWAYKSEEGTVVDSQCTGTFDTWYEKWEELLMPECVKKR